MTLASVYSGEGNYVDVGVSKSVSSRWIL